MLTRITKTSKKTDFDRKWYIVDAKNQVLGRLAAKVALVLTGKNKPNYSPNTDCGDYVVIINAKLIKTTGNKLADKVYYRHSGYLGGLSEITLEKLLIKDATLPIRKAVVGMLPKNRLSKDIIKKLKIYEGEKHEHEAQSPKLLKISND